jgi:acylglycerol lipase
MSTETIDRPPVIQPPGFPALPEGWETHWRTQPGSDGKVQLFLWVHRRKDVSKKPARVLFLIHGFGEHGGRYLHVPHFLNDAIDVVIVPDLRGHGRSEGLRGHVEHFDQHVEDLEGLVRQSVEKETSLYGKIQFHMLGHSMGGHVLLRLLPRLKGIKISSASVSAPFLGIYGPVPVVKKTAAYVLANVWGSLQMSTNVDARTISRDEGVIRAYQSDRLVHDKMTPRMFTSMVTAMGDTLKRVTGYDCPLLFQVPGQDRLVDQSKSLEYFERLQLPGKRLKTYPDSFHEPMNDLDKEVFFADLGAWIREHSKD